MAVKDIVHVGAVLGTGTKACDVELAEFFLLWKLNVVAEVTVIPLEHNHHVSKNHI